MLLFFLAQPLPIVPEVDKPFMSGEGERRNGPESAFVEKNFRLRVEEIALGFLRVYMSIISDAFHVYFTLLLNS